MKPLFTLLLSLFTLLSYSQWNTNVQQNNQVSFTGTESAVPYSVTHACGTTFVSWFSPGAGGDYYPYVQCVDALGYLQWPQAGIQVSNHTSMTWITDYDLAVSPDTSALIAFQDMRTGYNDIYIYKISATGDFLWGPDGVQLSNEPFFEANPVIATHPDNSVVVAWPRSPDAGDGTIIAQRLNDAGQKQWTPDLVLGESGFDYTWPRVVAAEDGNTIIVWYKEWGPYWAPNRAIMAQKFSPAGTPVWPFSVSLFSGVIPVYVHPLVAPDGSGGAYVAWTYEKVSNHLSSFVQHVDANGTVTMPSGGVEVSLGSNLHLEPGMGSDTTTGSLYIFWRETNAAQTQYGVYGQKIEPDGTLSWGNNGKMLVGLSSKNAILIQVNGLPGGCVVSYLYDFASGTGQMVKAARLDEAGNLVWPGGILDVSTAQSGKGYLSSGDFMNSQFVFSWSDNRLGHTEIFAQNLSVEGLPGPMTWNMDVTPDTLWFLTPESTAYGLPFYVYNPNDYAIDIQHIDQFGIIRPDLVPWYVDPHINTFPVSVAAGDTFSRLVRFFVIDGPFSGPLAYDTLTITTLSDTAHVIIAVDTLLIWLAKEELKADPLRAYPNPFSDRVTIEFNGDASQINAIRIFDVMGREVRRMDGRRRTAVGSPRSAVCSQVVWDGRSDDGATVPPGVYVVAVEKNGRYSHHTIIKK